MDLEEKNINEEIKKHIYFIPYMLKKYNLSNDDMAYSIALLAMWRALIKYDETKGKFTTIAGKYISYELLRYIRDRKCKKNSLMVFTDEFIHNKPATADTAEVLDIEDEYISAERAQTIEKAVKETLKEFKGYKAKGIIEYWVDSNFQVSGAEIGRVFNMKRQSVNSILQRYRKALRQKLDDMNFWQ